MHDGRGRVLTETRLGQFEHRSSDGDLSAVRRPFFDWLERRPSSPAVREDLLRLVSSVANEMAGTSSVGFTLTADDGGDNVLVGFLLHDGDDERPARLGRGLAAVDRLAHRLSIDVVPMAGDGYVLLDVLLPSA